MFAKKRKKFSKPKSLREKFPKKKAKNRDWENEPITYCQFEIVKKGVDDLNRPFQIIRCSVCHFSKTRYAEVPFPRAECYKTPKMMRLHQFKKGNQVTILEKAKLDNYLELLKAREWTWEVLEVFNGIIKIKDLRKKDYETVYLSSRDLILNK